MNIQKKKTSDESVGPESGSTSTKKKTPTSQTESDDLDALIKEAEVEEQKEENLPVRMRPGATKVKACILCLTQDGRSVQQAMNCFDPSRSDVWVDLNGNWEVDGCNPS